MAFRSTINFALSQPMVLPYDIAFRQLFQPAVLDRYWNANVRRSDSIIFGVYYL